MDSGNFSDMRVAYRMGNPFFNKVMDPIGLFLIFLTLWLAFFLLGGAPVLGMPVLHTLGGWVGLVCGAMAMYGSFALVTNATYGREIIPTGSR